MEYNLFPFSCCWHVSPLSSGLVAVAIAPLSPCQSSCTMDQKRSWWTLLRETLVDPQLRELLSFQLSSCDPAVYRGNFETLKREPGLLFFDNFLLLRKATFTVFNQVELKLLHSSRPFAFTQVLLNNMQQCNCRVITPTWTGARRCYSQTRSVHWHKPPYFVICSGKVSLSPPQCCQSPTEHTPTCYLLYFYLSVNG